MRFKAAVCLLLAAGAVGMAPAAVWAADDPFAAFDWQFDVTRGDSAIGVGRMRLKAEPEKGQNCHVFEQSATPKAWLRWISGEVLEESHFCVGEDGQIQPSFYRYYRDGFGADKENIELRFDLSERTVSDDRGRSWPWTPGMVDRLLMQLALRQKVMDFAQHAAPPRQETEFELDLIDRRGPDHWTFSLTAGDRQQTRFGTLATWRLDRIDKPERRSQIWIAPSLDWAVLKAEQQKKDDPLIRLTLTSHR